MELMGISTSELLSRVHRAGYPEVNEMKLTRWKHRRLIESHRPGRGRGRGRERALWDEAMCGTACAIAHFLRTKRDLGDAALSAWLAGNPVPLPTVRRLLIRSGERWLEPLPLSVALPLDLSESERITRLPHDGGRLDEQIKLQAEALANKASILVGIPRRYRLPLVGHAVKVALGLATQRDLRDALKLLVKVAPELAEWFNWELARLGDSVRLVAPFSVAVIRRVIGAATEADLLEARKAYARSLPYTLLIIFLTLILWSGRARVGPDLVLVLAPLLTMQNAGYAFTSLLLEGTRK